jgi:hypothetical protein
MSILSLAHRVSEGMLNPESLSKLATKPPRKNFGFLQANSESLAKFTGGRAERRGISDIARITQPIPYKRVAVATAEFVFSDCPSASDSLSQGSTRKTRVRAV